MSQCISCGWVVKGIKENTSKDYRGHHNVPLFSIHGVETTHNNATTIQRESLVSVTTHVPSPAKKCSISFVYVVL
jgi:hypothetical protein